MTNAEHWPLVNVTLADGTETQVRQFQIDPEELRRLNAEAERAAALARHYNVRAKVQLALFDRSKSTAEIVAEGIEWAKATPTHIEPPPAEDNEPEDSDKEWDQRAVVMAAALAARDYEGPIATMSSHWQCPCCFRPRRKRQ